MLHVLVQALRSKRHQIPKHIWHVLPGFAHLEVTVQKLAPQTYTSGEFKFKQYLVTKQVTVPDIIQI